MFMFWCNQQCCGSGSGQISTATFSEVRNFFPSRSRIDRSFSLINEEWKPRWLYKFVSRSLENKVEGEQNMGANSSVTNGQKMWVGDYSLARLWGLKSCGVCQGAYEYKKREMQQHDPDSHHWLLSSNVSMTCSRHTPFLYFFFYMFLPFILTCIFLY